MIRENEELEMRENACSECGMLPLYSNAGKREEWGETRALGINPEGRTSSDPLGSLNPGLAAAPLLSFCSRIGKLYSRLTVRLYVESFFFWDLCTTVTILVIFFVFHWSVKLCEEFVIWLY